MHTTFPLSFKHSYITLAISLSLVACVSVPPESTTLRQTDGNSVQLPDNLRQAAEGAWPRDDWWQRYGDEQLNRLIEQALHDSPSLEAAAARVNAAQAALVITRASDEVGVGVDASANRQRYSANGLLPAPIGGGTFSDFNVQLGIRKDLDVWGKNRSLITAAAGEKAARQAEQVQVRQALALSVAQSYFEYQADGAVMADLQEQLAIQQALVADKQKRQARGLVSSDEALVEQTKLAELKRRLAEVQAHALAEREALRALVGGNAPWINQLAIRPLPTPHEGVPAQLGFELLARRPDLQATHLRVEAAMSRVEAAQAAFYPEINLSASLGLDSLSLSDLFQASSRTFFIGPTLSLPIFKRDSLKGQLASVRSGRDELIANYNQQVLDATREVAQTVAAIKGLDKQLEQQQAMSTNTAALQRNTKAKLDRGLSDRASLLRADVAALQDKQAELALIRQRLQADLRLTRALGGGYHAVSTATAQAKNTLMN
jgi:multidrug efflux system outer membrane protein